MQRYAVRPSQWFLLLVLLVVHGTAASAQLVSCSVTPTSPVAVDDHVRWPGGPLVVDVLGNDYDPDGDAFVIQAFSPAAHGTVAYTTDFEAILYTPNGDGAVSDQFTYTIYDGQSTSTATVYLQNDAPPPPPPPPPAEVWIEGSCNNLNCTFTAYWRNISDTPRYFHWQWDDGTTTPPFYNARSALKGLSPGTHIARVTVTFVSGTVISAQMSIPVATPQHTCTMNANAFGLQMNARITDTSTDENGDAFDAYDYFYDFDDGVGLRPVDPWSVFQLTGLSYATPGTRTINFIIRPRGSTTVVGQCPTVLEFTNEPPRPTIDQAVGGDGVSRPKKQFRFTPSGWDEWYNQLGPWEWSFGDGASTTTSGPTVVEHYYARPGNYTVTLKVTDSLGAVGTVDGTITVPNDPPVVAWKFNCAGRTCTFDATGSSDDSDVLTYSWNFGDGTPVATTSIATHTFTADQFYDVVLTVSDGTVSTPLTKRVSPRGAPLAEQLLFYALPPCRVLDTRLGGRPPLAAGSLNEYVITGTCGVPAGAKAVAVNAAVISPTQTGWLQMYPTGIVAGEPSLLNFTPARSPRTDNTIVALGANGAVIVRPSIASAGTAHLTLDVTGYFTTELTGIAPARGPMRFDRHGDFPARLFDSRTTPPSVATGTPRHIKARNSSFAYLPVDAEAHALVVTAFNPTAAGHFVLFPSDIAATPLASAMNFQTVPQANGSLMALGRRTNDDLALVYATGGSSTTDVTVDTYGWFARNGKYRYSPLQPCRAVDTRLAQHGSPRLTHNAARALQIQGNCGVPHGAKFAVVGATVVNPDGAGSAQIGATSDPGIAAIQFAAGDTIANTVIVSLTQSGAANCCTGDLHTLVNIPAGGGADLVVDVFGYFMPEVNQAPVAVGDAATAVINVPLTIDVLANDSDANGDTIKLSTTRAVFNPPALGTATRASDTSITYSSTLSGPDTFDYEVIDTRGGISHGRVTLNVRATNAAPAASPDSASTTSNSSVTVDVLANDSDPDGDSLTVASVGAATKGTTAVAANRVLYTPSAGSSGTDTFTYTARDPFGASSSAAVTITITAANNPPRAVEDSATIYVGETVAITPLANDTDPDGDPLKLSNPAIIGQLSFGTAVRTNDTTITYTAGSTAGSDVFQYSIHDGRGLTAQGAITVVVQPICTGAPAISAQPSSRTINVGQPTTFSVTAAGGAAPLTYQWYQGTAPSTATPVGTNSNSFTVSPTSTTSYWVKVTNTCGSTNSATATVTVCTPPAITTQPASQSIVVGNTATLTVAATGSAPLSYQWFEGQAGITTTPVGTNSNSFTTPALTASKTYWVRVTSTCNGTATVNSAAAVITVTCAGPPVITTPPASVAINGGQSATLSVTASAAASYQWYQGAAGVTTTPVGTNSRTLTVSPAATTSYWVRVTNSCGSVDSGTVTVTVCAPLTITTQPGSPTITTGSTATLTVAAGGSGPFTYQWYEGASGVTTTPVGTNSASFTTPVLTANKSYWVRVTGTCNGSTSVNSNTAVVTVTCATAPSISVQPTSRTINAGQSTTFSVTASGYGTLTYQWYQGAAGVTSTPVGTNSSSFTVTPGATTSYWVKVSNACGGTNSTVATVTVCTPPSITAHPASVTIAYGGTATLSVTAAGSAPLSYQWYEGAAGVTTIPVGANSASFTTPSLTTNKSYWVRVTSTCNGSASVNSNAALVTAVQPLGRRQFAAGSASSQLGVTTNWPQATQAGNLLVAVASAQRDFYPVANWQVPAGWQLAATYELGNVKTSIYYYPNNPGGRTSETFNTGGYYDDVIVQLAEYTGVATVSPLDKTAFNGAWSHDGYIDTGYTPQTTQAKELVVTALTMDVMTDFHGPSQGFVEVDDRHEGSRLTAAFHEKFVTTAGSWGHYVQVPDSAEWVGLVVTFKAAQ